MGIFDAGKACTFSAISGTITLNGQPAANAELIRTAEFAGRKKVDKTTTDANGHFAMPAVFVRSILNILPQEFVADQSIVVHHQGKKYEIWSGTKRRPEENAESRGKPLVVSCKLESKESLIYVNRSPIFSQCTWDVEPDEWENPFKWREQHDNEQSNTESSR